MKTEQLIPLCQRYQALLLDSNEHTIAIAVVDAPAPELLEALRFATQKRIDIEGWSQDQMDKRLQTPGISTLTPPVEASASIVEQVNSLLEQALRQRASDIHIEPGDDRLRIRLRVDGVLHSLAPLAPELAAPITARLKVLSNLDIAEHRVPQDGQFTLTLADRPISSPRFPAAAGKKSSFAYYTRSNKRWTSKRWGYRLSSLPPFARRLTNLRG